MANRVYQIVDGLSEYREGYSSMGRGPTFREIGELEAVFKQNYAASQAAVHVITGKLKASGNSHTNFDGDTWKGEISYLRNPGIFELDRADKPTANHPEGQHDSFFGVAEKFKPQYEAVLKRMVDKFWEGKNG